MKYSPWRTKSANLCKVTNILLLLSYKPNFNHIKSRKWKLCAYLYYEHFITFVNRWEKKYPVLRKYKAQRNIAYFTYMDFPVEVQRCIYTTNWIERLNRKYKRTIKMRAAMPSSQSVLFLLASVAMEETQTTYRRKVYQWRCWKESK